MKTVELRIGNQTAQFTTKTLTYNGQEYFYSRMTRVMNDPVNHRYAFVYDGQVVVLPYQEKDTRILNAIFGQVSSLARQAAARTMHPAPQGQAQLTPQQVQEMQHRQQMKQAQAMNQNAASAQAPGESQMQQTKSSQAQDSGEQTAPLGAMPAQTQQIVPQPPETQPAQRQTTPQTGSRQPIQIPPQAAPESQMQTAEAPAAENAAYPLSKEELRAQRKAEKMRLKAEKRALRAGKKEIVSAAPAADAEAHDAAAELSPEEEALRKQRRKKAIITFSIIIAALAVAALIWYFALGTSGNPTADPNATQKQTYDNIDDLIDGLE